MGNGRLTQFFAGGHSYHGFHSFFDHIIDHREANRIFIIKGGPGVGKSTFMRRIGEEMLGRNFDVEFHCCSSDHNSLDGVVIQELGVAILDGTAPHVIDPKYPGAVDEIIHLGEFWNDYEMRARRREIMDCDREIQRHYRRSYAHLAAAKIFVDEIRRCYIDADVVHKGRFNHMSLDLIHDIFDGHQGNAERPRVRRLFASALTNEGTVSHLNSIMDHVGRRYFITGDEGTGKHTLTARVLDAAVMRGFHVHAFHCVLEPELIDHLIIPELNVGIINAVEPHDCHPRERDRVINTMECIHPMLHERHMMEKNRSHRMYQECMEESIACLRQAKAKHDELERFYTPCMDFRAIEDRKEKTLEQILCFTSYI